MAHKYLAETLHGSQFFDGTANFSMHLNDTPPSQWPVVAFSYDEDRPENVTLVDPWEIVKEPYM